MAGRSKTPAKSPHVKQGPMKGSGRSKSQSKRRTAQGATNDRASEETTPPDAGAEAQAAGASAQAKTEQNVAEDSASLGKNNASNAGREVVDSVNESAPPTNETAGNKEYRTVQLTLKGLNKKGTDAIYTGAGANVRIPVAAFANKTPDQALDISGSLVPAKAAKPKMTAEERKAARAARPKPTLAEKIAAREAALEKLRLKAQAEASGAPAQ